MAPAGDGHDDVDVDGDDDNGDGHHNDGDDDGDVDGDHIDDDEIQEIVKTKKFCGTGRVVRSSRPSLQTMSSSKLRF